MKKKYLLPKPTYIRILWSIREYEQDLEMINYLREKAQSVGSPIISDEPKPPFKTESKIERYACEVVYLENKVKPIQNALKDIPEEYRQLILDHINGYIDYYSDAFAGVDINKYKAWKQKFIFDVGKGMYADYIKIISHAKYDDNFNFKKKK